MANLVAKRCAVLDRAQDRQLVWSLQWLSHQQRGGLEAYASGFLDRYRENVGHWKLRECNLAADKVVPQDVAQELLEAADSIELYQQFGIANHHTNLFALAMRRNPHYFTKGNLHKLCLEAARSQLADWLRTLCLNPEIEFDLDPNAADPWYFDDLTKCLREDQARRLKEHRAQTVVTELGEKIEETLDYALEGRRLTLMEGEARRGKSFAARAWCEQHPGCARYMEVPPGNDEKGFFRAIARSLGLSIPSNAKAHDLRDRAEEVLLTGDLALVMDEAHQCWPQKNYRYGYPQRIIWVMAMANQGVPIALITTPQFFQTQKFVKERLGWNDSQLVGRISHYVRLPEALSEADLTKVARVLLPEAGAEVLRALAIYARKSARYLAAIDTIASRARFLAGRAGRPHPTTEDVRRAMKESVIPSDSNLVQALDQAAPRAAKRHQSPLGEPPAPPAPQLRDPGADTPPSPGAGDPGRSGGRLVKLDFAESNSALPPSRLTGRAPLAVPELAQ